MSATAAPAAAELLKQTIARCPQCGAQCPGEVWRVPQAEGAQVIMRRQCRVHGPSESLLASDARFYWLAKGDPANSSGGCGTSCACSADPAGFTGTLGRNALTPDTGECERLATCLALIEIVDSCNLACPTCFADSPKGALQFHPLPDLQRRIEGVIARKGRLEILQLSGGEPTLHPQFFELLTWLMQHPKIDYVLLNTNGVKIAAGDDFATRLAQTIERGKFQLYLQFDGLQAAAQHLLRGADLRPMREKVLAVCEALTIPVTLAMTVNHENLAHLWEAAQHGLRFRCIRGISYQPMFLSGRIPAAETGPRLNTADIVTQADGTLRWEDFTPLPCGDPNCATIGYLLKTPDGPRSVSDFIHFSDVQDFLRDKVRYSLDDLARCGCEDQPLAGILKGFELDAANTFRLFIKPFMDAHTWDEDRIDRCCTHVIRPDGKLDSFCRYYSGFADASCHTH
jgi:7,8-dihydro-6-hydroxymethylpterin dimethyltransferase